MVPFFFPLLFLLSLFAFYILHSLIPYLTTDRQNQSYICSIMDRDSFWSLYDIIYVI